MAKNVLPLTLLALCSALYASDPSSGKPTLVQQYQNLREQSELIESFRMLRTYQVENFWKSVQDTLRAKDQAMASVNERISGYESQLAGMHAALEKQQAAVSEMEFAGEHITFLGIDFAKATFTSVAVITVLSLVALTILAFLACRSAYNTYRETKSLYDDVSREFEAYKHRVVEKEVKLLRELQDYRNRIVELRSA
jgi:hypothetical protein